MLTFSLPSFLKMCQLDSHGRHAALDAKLNKPNSGYPFHRPLRDAINAHIDGADQADIDEILNAPSQEHQRRYNRNAFDAFVKRFGKDKSIAIVRETEIYPVHAHGIEITVSPWFSTVENGHTYLHVVWATSKPALERRNANIGCLI